MRSSGRDSDQLREVSLNPSVNLRAEGAYLADCDTRIVCTASLETRVEIIRQDADIARAKRMAKEHDYGP